MAVLYLVAMVYGMLQLDRTRLAVLAVLAATTHGTALFMLIDSGRRIEPAAAWTQFGALVLALAWYVKDISGGMSNVEYLASLQLASPRLCAAHCVWVDDDEQRLLAEHDVKVMHCPGSNLKLGSGVAPVPEMLARGITVSLGADGAACNNRLDMFEEMRLAAILQATRRHPGILAARDVLWMATRNGARTLGLGADIGSIEPGKLADVIVVDRDRPHLAPGPDPIRRLCIRPAAATCARRSSTARCWSTSSRRSASTAWKSRQKPDGARVSLRLAPA